ncbi:MAG TPA: hypothetical protein ENK01_01885 [Hellea balneolensis]|uniref:Tetratricopeptide repeat protein n=1 Tax=Hellea balneolensis TaxID=287478 RepID=A0A7V5U123_9PROT|nr:hypothetical protein [Hellea balneolensis]
MAKGLQLSLRRKHKQATAELAQLNREMAMHMISLAMETGEVEPLIDAVKALRSSEELYSQETACIEQARLQKKLGDVLLNIGKNEHNGRALAAAIEAYRGAITIASLLGAHNLRTELRKSHALALNYAGKGKSGKTISLMGAA